jgi:hypothetical protein
MLRALLVPACGIVALAGCGAEQGHVATGGTDLTLEQAEIFDDFPLYFAGESVDDLPLVAILRRKDTANYVSFVYGDCQPADPEQGCAPPAEVQVWPREERPRERYDSPAEGSPAAEPTTIRRTAAAFFEGRTRLELFAGPSTVVIFAGSAPRVLAVAAALRCVRDRGRGPPGGPLDC